MGWNGSAQSGVPPVKPMPPARRPSALIWLFAGAACIVVCSVLCFVLLSSSDDTARNLPKKGAVRAATPSKKQAAGVAQSSEAAGKGADAPKDAVSKERKPPLKQTRESIAPPAPLADIAEKLKPPSMPFKTSTENYIAMAIPAGPGVGVPPIPIPEDVDFSEDMKKAFSTPIVAEDGDTEETIKRKIAVLDHKEELQELASKEGWTLPEYVNAIRDKYLAANDYLAECHEILENAYADPDISDDSYIAMRDKINEALKNRGLPEIMSASEEAEQLAAEDAEPDNKTKEE